MWEKNSHLIIGWTVVLSALMVCLSVLAWTYTTKFDNRVAPNVFVGELDVGQKTPEEVRFLLQTRIDQIMTRGISVHNSNQTYTLPLSTLVGSDFIEYATFNTDAMVTQALSTRHDPNPVVNMGQILFASVRPTHLFADVQIKSSELNKALHVLFAKEEHLAKETTYNIKKNANGWDVEIQAGIAGDEIDERMFDSALLTELESLSLYPIALVKTMRAPAVSFEQAQTTIPTVQAILRAAPFILTFADESSDVQEWKLTADELARMLIPNANNTVSLQPEMFGAFLEPIRKSLNVPVQNARFQIQNGRVSEFAPSKNGRVVDEETLLRTVISQMTRGSTSPIQIPTHTVESIVKTNEVNSLGIQEVLGVGISNYGKSPKNRKLNIQNGVNLLNGLLIAPGETFSLLAALKPFTTDNGYLRELVIKGDKIEPDIGGGLCQIGTTTFRAVMHAGLPIVERQNHSLVVSYYNDPSNGNPGTDATIFDPSPDFKFTNDTGQYLLLQTENIKEKSELRFTLWGTSDGRKGSYTPPIVSRWIPYGEEIKQPSPDLKPGEEKCQEAHKGADASFIYTIQNPDGTKIDKVFASHYRPLPKICLVGVEPNLDASTDLPLPPSL